MMLVLSGDFSCYSQAHRDWQEASCANVVCSENISAIFSTVLHPFFFFFVHNAIFIKTVNIHLALYDNTLLKLHCVMCVYICVHTPFSKSSVERSTCLKTTTTEVNRVVIFPE